MPEIDLSTIALCNVEDVKRNMDALQISSQRDPVITQYINLFSAGIQGGRYCNRELEYGAKTEFYDGSKNDPSRTNRKLVRVSAPPIVSTLTLDVYDDPDFVFPSTTLLTLWEDYTVNYAAGLVTKVTGTFGSGYHSIKMAYTGGLVYYDAGSEGYTTNPPDDLRNACAMQVAHWFRNRQDQGAESIMFPGGQGAATFFEPTQLLPMVYAVVMNNRVF